MTRLNNLPEDLIFDDSFQDFVLKQDKAASRKWTQWIRENPEYEEEFQHARKILQSVKIKDYELSSEKFEIDVDRLKTAIHKNADEKSTYKTPVVSLHSLWGRIAAAIIILMAASGIFYYISFEGATSPTVDVAVNPFVSKNSPLGTKTLITLSDGTKVKLNAGSTLEYKEVFEDQRLVKLHGEAFFEVTRDTLRPFVIHSGDLEVKVLGTSFNVKAYDEDEDVEVAVATGLVSVREQNSTPDSRILIEPMQRAIYSKSNKTLATSRFDSDMVFGWRDGILAFRDSEFADIVMELERWYGVQISVDEDVKIQKGYTGKFQNETLQRVLEGLSFSLDFQYRIDKNNVEIFK